MRSTIDSFVAEPWWLMIGGGAGAGFGLGWTSLKVVSMRWQHRLRDALHVLAETAVSDDSEYPGSTRA